MLHDMKQYQPYIMFLFTKEFTDAATCGMQLQVFDTDGIWMASEIGEVPFAPFSKAN